MLFQKFYGQSVPFLFLAKVGPLGTNGKPGEIQEIAKLGGVSDTLPTMNVSEDGTKKSSVMINILELHEQ